MGKANYRKFKTKNKKDKEEDCTEKDQFLSHVKRILKLLRKSVFKGILNLYKIS